MQGFTGMVISVYNQGTSGSVDGALTATPLGSPTNPLCARVVDPETNRLSVAPCFLPNVAAGPYWPVILKADDQGRYTAVAVIGGQPSVRQSDGCSLAPVSEVQFGTGVGGAGVSGNVRTQYGNEGLWILTRDRIAAPGAPHATVHIQCIPLYPDGHPQTQP